MDLWTPQSVKSTTFTLMRTLTFPNKCFNELESELPTDVYKEKKNFNMLATEVSQPNQFPWQSCDNHFALMYPVEKNLKLLKFLIVISRLGTENNWGSQLFTQYKKQHNILWCLLSYYKIKLSVLEKFMKCFIIICIKIKSRKYGTYL